MIMYLFIAIQAISSQATTQTIKMPVLCPRPTVTPFHRMQFYVMLFLHNALFTKQIFASLKSQMEKNTYVASLPPPSQPLLFPAHSTFPHNKNTYIRIRHAPLCDPMSPLKNNTIQTVP